MLKIFDNLNSCMWMNISVEFLSNKLCDISFRFSDILVRPLRVLQVRRWSVRHVQLYHVIVRNLTSFEFSSIDCRIPAVLGHVFLPLVILDLHKLYADDMLFKTNRFEVFLPDIRHVNLFTKFSEHPIFDLIFFRLNFRDAFLSFSNRGL